jgi:hypothetical protein
MPAQITPTTALGQKFGKKLALAPKKGTRQCRLSGLLYRNIDYRNLIYLVTNTVTELNFVILKLLQKNFQKN